MTSSLAGSEIEKGWVDRIQMDKAMSSSLGRDAPAAETGIHK